MIQNSAFDRRGHRTKKKKKKKAHLWHEANKDGLGKGQGSLDQPKQSSILCSPIRGQFKMAGTNFFWCVGFWNEIFWLWLWLWLWVSISLNFTGQHSARRATLTVLLNLYSAFLRCTPLAMPNTSIAYKQFIPGIHLYPVLVLQFRQSGPTTKCMGGIYREDTNPSKNV